MRAVTASGVNVGVSMGCVGLRYSRPPPLVLFVSSLSRAHLLLIGLACGNFVQANTTSVAPAC